MVREDMQIFISSGKSTNSGHPPTTMFQDVRKNRLGQEEKTREIAIVPKLSSIVSPGRLYWQVASAFGDRTGSDVTKRYVLYPHHTCAFSWIERPLPLVHRGPRGVLPCDCFPAGYPLLGRGTSPRRCSHLQQSLREGNDGSVQLSRGSTTCSDRFTRRGIRRRRRRDEIHRETRLSRMGYVQMENSKIQL